jgi:hypothetical protein
MSTVEFDISKLECLYETTKEAYRTGQPIPKKYGSPETFLLVLSDMIGEFSSKQRALRAATTH